MNPNGEASSSDRVNKRATLHWTVGTIDELNTRELHALLKLRVDVFVVEQACAYPEVDDLDAAPDTVHLLAQSGSDVIATARAMAPGPCGLATSGVIDSGETTDEAPLHIAVSEDTTGDNIVYNAARIGRVAVHPSWRGRGLARQMLLRLMQEIEQRHGCVDIVLGAQTIAVRLYEGLGFEVISNTYLEDGIEHVDMCYRAADKSGKAGAALSD